MTKQWTPPSPEINNPDAYYRAKEARIKANRWKTGHRNLQAAIADDSPEFKAWLTVGPIPAVTELSEEFKARGFTEIDMDSSEEWWTARNKAEAAFRKTYGPVPKFITDSMNEWGGLTDRQLAMAREIWAERAEKAAKRDAHRAAQAAAAQPWDVEGRQVVVGEIVTVKEVENDFGFATKVLLVTAEGRKLWVTAPSAIPADRGSVITMAVAVKVSDDDPSFAFGSRPTKPAVLSFVSTLIPVEV